MQDMLAPIDERQLAGDRAGLAPSGVLCADLQRQNPMPVGQLQLLAGTGFIADIHKLQVLRRNVTAFDPATEVGTKVGQARPGWL